MKTKLKATRRIASVIAIAIITLALVALSSTACDNGNSTSSHTHEWGDWVVTTPATCTDEGVKTKTCALDATHKETQAIPIDPTAHDWGDWTVTTPATVEAEGVETKTCRYNQEHTETRAIPKIQLFTSVAALGTWLASQPENTADTAYTVKLNTNNITNIRTTLNSATNKYVNIDLSGSTITSIADFLFLGNAEPYGCATLTGIILPNSITSIGTAAFGYCTSLTSVTIPRSVSSMENVPFISCTRLTEINVDAGNSAYTSENGVLYNKNKTVLLQYPAGKTDSTFSIPNNVTNIGMSSFGEARLTSLIISTSVTSIGLTTFVGCTNLTSVTFQGTIPSSGFASDAFGNSTNPTYYLGDLRAKYLAGGIGTYTRPSGGLTWTKVN